MLKKILVSAIAAAALSVPLAGVAGADTTNGTPGNFGAPPGGPSSTVETVSDFAHSKAPGSLPQQNGAAQGSTSQVPPGQTIKTYAPGQQK